ncbi:MAG: hypothetical protein A2W93_15615 [Bacteroidetes bacterium GWF2_43_63]|nr:MAG: hypothetical protein A2W94_05390 [Bacteroidetes bacterium GWE2_42_42]OFY53446.1 MAG: hypothetical protein A2W93_15615 [Bacteroidetes bacterium GWF2_43_63]HBG69378.1 hypothetical protein [Bacteroidales bacterium]HCB61996.1 hypothetical protein [Bacteroidales bacterium]HCY23167.1 hypothetical protein [Bacteroidales bacterium]
MGNFRDDSGASRLWCGLDMNFKRTKKYGHEKRFTDEFGKAQACFGKGRGEPLRLDADFDGGGVCGGGD